LIAHHLDDYRRSAFMRKAISLLLLAAFTSPTFAVDLTKIDRSLRKEPAYQSKAPKYGLLVFGPEAKTRVWLVLDGKRLFVDRNGNGDLTDDGEPIAAVDGGRKDLELLNYEIGEIQDGPRTHKEVRLQTRNMDYLAEQYPDIKKLRADSPEARGLFLRAEIEMPGWKGNGSGGRVEYFMTFRDANGFLTFTDKPREAPIIHFGGPWQIACPQVKQLIPGFESERIVQVGTPGLGVGTFASMAYEGVIPEKAYPRVEIVFPPKNPGDAPVKRLYELKERC
jgi:hypothetical protein